MGEGEDGGDRLMSFGPAGNWSTGEWRSRLGALKALGVLMLAMIVVHVFNALILGHAWDRYGILPSHADGLWPGAVSAPFLHVSNIHLANNLVALMALGGMAAMVAGNTRFVAATIFIALVGAAGTWLIARGGSHIGASGLVFGYFGFLLGQGLFRQSLLSLVVAGGVTFLYGANIFFGIFFPRGCTSWEAHLAGALAGLAYARVELLFVRRVGR
jgi:membrane associated rhomboid family serine protease